MADIGGVTDRVEFEQIMVAILLPADETTSIDRAVEKIQTGGLVAFPTDTVYGVGASIQHPGAIQTLYAVKQRDQSKAIPVLLGDPNQLTLIGIKVGYVAMRLAEVYWPGPLTLVIPKHPSLPDNLSPTDTLGARMPDHPVALDLLCKSGPLAVTSANISGGVNSRTAQEVVLQLGSSIDLILDGGKTPGGIPSTVVNCTTEALEVIRPGPISLYELLETIS